MSEASNLNAPFDCLVYINNKVYVEYMFQTVCKIFPKMDRKVLWQTVWVSVDYEIDKQISNMNKKFRIACFTENSLSPLVWAHYADIHDIIAGIYLGLKSFDCNQDILLIH